MSLSASATVPFLSATTSPATHPHFDEPEPNSVGRTRPSTATLKRPGASSAQLRV